MDWTPAPGGSRDLPPFTLLLFLLVAVLVGSLLGGGLVLALCGLKGVDLQELLAGLDENSPLPDRNFIRLINLVSHFLTFTVPSIAVAVLFFRKRWSAWLRLDRQPVVQNLILGILFIMAAFPVAQTTYWINQQIPLPEWAHSMESSAMGMLKSLLVMKSPSELLFNLLVVGVLPAIGEELLFRGMIQQGIERWWGHSQPALWATAILFSAIHMQFEGFLPRLLLGAVLGYLFLWTRNLWVPVVAHFLFNSTQVVAQFVAGEGSKVMNMEEVQDPQWAAFAAGLAVLTVTGYTLYQRNRSDRSGTDNDSPS